MAREDKIGALLKYSQFIFLETTFTMSNLQIRMANAIRALSMDAVQKANSGHPGLPMGAADIATVLFTQFLKFDASDPHWADRDRFILSAGHGSMLLYSLLHLTGYADMTLDEVKNFRQMGARTAGHPEFGHATGIETTTGPLGQGIANAVGMAIAERMLAAEFNRPDHTLIDHYTYVFMGDGCMMEGISHEACALAGTLGLGKLIALYDDNHITIDGNTNVSFTEDVLKRYEAYGWHTIHVPDGNTNVEAIANAIAPLPVPKSKTFVPTFARSAQIASTRSTSNSVSGRGISARRSTFSFSP